MYIELKEDGLRGWGRIGRVTFSKTGKTLYYRGRNLAPLEGHALKANYIDTNTGEELWISRPRADGRDSLHPTVVEVDHEAREAYWREVRGKPEGFVAASYRSPGKSKRDRDSQQRAVRRRDMDRRYRPPRLPAPVTLEETERDPGSDGRDRQKR
jgi:hypothetical protein